VKFELDSATGMIQWLNSLKISGYSSCPIDEYMNDLDAYMLSINSDSVSAFSTFLDKMKNEPSSASLTEAQRLEKLADFHEQQYREYSRVAADAAAKAESLGDPARAAIWSKTADMITHWADERANLADDAWMQRTYELGKGNIGKYLGPAGDVVSAYEVVAAARANDWDTVGAKSTGVLYGLGGVALGAAIASGPLGWGAVGVGALGAGFGFVATKIGDWVGATVIPWIRDGVSDLFSGAHTWIFRRDPLTLDLDGDGLETVGIDTGRIVYFDHYSGPIRQDRNRSNLSWSVRLSRNCMALPHSC
jgi:hypothetical protein